jgi:cation:H+ antiporter
LLLLAFAAVIVWWVIIALRHKNTEKLLAASESEEDVFLPLKPAIFWLIVGLILLVASSRMLVWGAVEIATSLGVSDLMIGLTIVAVGTSLPELAAAVAAARKKAHDLVLGNIIGSNIFNTLAVVGIAGLIHPLDIGGEVLYRDCLIMGILTCCLFGTAWRGRYCLSRLFGSMLLLSYVAYLGLLGLQILGYL